MSNKRAELVAVIDCCRVCQCEDCPMLDTICDDPFVKFEQFPAPVIEAIREELVGEPEGRLQ